MALVREKSPCNMYEGYKSIMWLQRSRLSNKLRFIVILLYLVQIFQKQCEDQKHVYSTAIKVSFIKFY